MNARTVLTLAALAMFAAVALGAFGAHALASRLAPDKTALWHTAVEYHAWHALGMLAVGVWLAVAPERTALVWAAWLFLAGIVLFSGSLYALALTGTRALGAVTPVGGLAFLAGWLAIAFAAWR